MSRPTRGHGLCPRVGRDPIAVGHELPIRTDASLVRSLRRPPRIAKIRYPGDSDTRGAGIGNLETSMGLPGLTAATVSIAGKAEQKLSQPLMFPLTLVDICP